jgi:hypothetical protein
VSRPPALRNAVLARVRKPARQGACPVFAAQPRRPASAGGQARCHVLAR